MFGHSRVNCDFIFGENKNSHKNSFCLFELFSIFLKYLYSNFSFRTGPTTIKKNIKGLQFILFKNIKKKVLSSILFIYTVMFKPELK